MVLLAVEWLNENVRAFEEYWAKEELVLRHDGKTLKVLGALRNGEKYSAVHCVWFQKFMTESLRETQNYNVLKEEFGGKVVPLGNRSKRVESWDVSE